MHQQPSAAEAVLVLIKRQHEDVFVLQFFLLMSRKCLSCCHLSPGSSSEKCLQEQHWTKLSNLVTGLLLLLYIFRQKVKKSSSFARTVDIPASFILECIILQQNHH